MGFPNLFKRKGSLSDADVSRIAGELRSFSLKNPGPLQEWAADSLGIETDSPSKPYKQSIWVYRCIQIWMRPATIPLLLKDAGGNDIDSGPVKFLIKSPNKDMTTAQFVERLLQWFGLKGEWFILREDGTNFTGLPSFLTIVPPGAMHLTAQDIDPQGNIINWRMKLKNGRERKIDPAGIIHDMLPNPYDPYRGMSPLESLRLTVDADYAARNHNKWQMKRHGRISNVISFGDDVSEEYLKVMSEMWREKYESADSAGKTAFLGGGAKLNQLSLSMKDMDWMQGQKISREEMCAAFGIPPNSAGILDKATYSNFEQSSRSMWEDTLIPLGNRIASKLNKVIVTPNAAGQALSFDFENSVHALQTDEKEKVERYEKLVKNKVSPKQAAAICQINIGEDPAHDIVWVGINEIPADAATIEPMPVPEKVLSSADVDALIDKRLSERVEGIDRASAASADNHNIHTKAETPVIDQLRQARGRSIIRQALPYERKMVKTLKPYFFGQRVSALRMFGELQARVKKDSALAMSPEDIANFLLSEKDWNKELLKRVMPIAQDASRFGAEELLREINFKKAVTEFTPEIVEAFHKQQASLLATVTETTREALVAVAGDLAAGLEAGVSPADLLDPMRVSMKGVFNNTEARRRTIGRTESLRAVNGGRHNQMVASGAPMKDWLSVRDGDVRDSHIVLDNDPPIAMDTDFVTINGSRLAFPLDPGAAMSDTVNCRCVTVAVFK